MLRNFFQVTIRNFLSQGVYSFINVLGLTSGIVCTLFIFLWLRDELQKDHFHKDAEKIFIVLSNLSQGENGIVTWGTPGPLADAVRDRIPEAELVARIQDNGSLLFQYQDKLFLEEGFFADPDFFRIFSYRMIQGLPPKQGTDKSWIYISQKLAVKLFGTSDALGKQLKIDKRHDVAVAGVFEDVSSASSLQFDFILPFEIYKVMRGQGYDWGNFDHPLFIKLRDNKNADEITATINKRVAAVNPLKEVEFYAQPFTENYLHGNFENGKPAGGRILYVKIFSVVGVFLLLIACINFMNMATARATTRAKEVGVRKVAGAQRTSLVFQFLGESLVISFLSTIAALIFVSATLPLFNSLVGKKLAIGFGQADLILTLTGLMLITALLAGSYPAFFLSSLRPASVLKGNLRTSAKGFPLRQILVVFQFSLTVILVAGSIVIYNQIQFIRNKNLGYDRAHVLAFSLTNGVANNFEAFKNEAMHLPGIKTISAADSKLINVNNQNGSVNWPGKSEENHPLFRTVVVDYGFLELMDLRLQQGRMFSKKFNDTSNFVVTEKAVKIMGMENPIGQKIEQWGIKGTIVGVVGDFHSRTLHEAVDPIIFMCNPAWKNTALVRFDIGQTSATVESLEKLYKKYSPGYLFEYSFLDDDFEKLYANEKVTGSLAQVFTGMAILISALGLLGLAAYTTERKKKEIGIRKTLGASVGALVAGISKDFLRLSFIAIIIGCPVAWYLLGKFLQGYAYHIDLDWKIFGVTALSVLGVSLLTVIFQVSKAAIANPMDALRNE